MSFYDCTNFDESATGSTDWSTANFTVFGKLAEKIVFFKKNCTREDKI